MFSYFMITVIYIVHDLAQYFPLDCLVIKMLIFQGALIGAWKHNFPTLIEASHSLGYLAKHVSFYQQVYARRNKVPYDSQETIMNIYFLQNENINVKRIKKRKQRCQVNELQDLDCKKY